MTRSSGLFVHILHTNKTLDFSAPCPWSQQGIPETSSPLPALLLQLYFLVTHSSQTTPSQQHITVTPPSSLDIGWMVEIVIMSLMLLCLQRPCQHLSLVGF